MSLAEGLAPSMSSMRRASTLMSRSASGLVKEVSPSSDIRGVASLWRRSVPRRSATKSKLSKRKAWKSVKMGGSHSPARGAVGNSNEPKQIVSLRLVRAGRAEDGGHPIAGTVDARCPPHGWCQIVGSGNGRQLNLLEVCIVRRDWIWSST
jgi:hypothetical protein